MKTKCYYVCEICDTEYSSKERAQRCEALGFAEPLPFLEFGKLVPVFATHGVLYTVLTGRVQIGIGHQWWLETDRPLAIAEEDWQPFGGHWVPATALDPRTGYDGEVPFSKGCAREDAFAWREAMASYGFAEVEADHRIVSRVWRAETGSSAISPLAPFAY